MIITDAQLGRMSDRQLKKLIERAETIVNRRAKAQHAAKIINTNTWSDISKFDVKRHWRLHDSVTPSFAKNKQFALDKFDRAYARTSRTLYVLIDDRRCWVKLADISLR